MSGARCGAPQCRHEQITLHRNFGAGAGRLRDSQRRRNGFRQCSRHAEAGGIHLGKRRQQFRRHHRHVRHAAACSRANTCRSRVTSASENLDPLWDGWDRPRSKNAWRYWNADSRSEFVRENSGRVLANLHDEKGEYMRCRFTLASPDRGMKGGGEGRCQLSDSGREINAEFRAPVLIRSARSGRATRRS